jgi:hypothetical protein
MVWSSGTIKKSHRHIENQMLDITPTKVTEEVHGKNVDGVSFDV